MRRLPSESIDFAVTDPPYLVNYKGRNGRSAYPNDTHPHWIKPAFAEIFRLLKKDRLCVSFYGWPKAEHFLLAWRAVGFYPVGHFVWVKGYASSRGFAEGRHESAYLLAKGFPPKPKKPISDVLRWEYEGNDLHPAQKPTGVLTPLIRAYSSPGDVVLDPFAGSGTTGIAARSCNRQFVLIEMVWRYYEIAKARLASRERDQGSNCQSNAANAPTTANEAESQPKCATP